MSKLTLVIGNKNYSSWSLRPWIFMKQFNMEFNEIRIPLFTDDTDQQLASYFSNYKVPVLCDDNFIVWDTLSIMEYVSEQYLDSRGWPQDVKARAVARSVSAEMHSSFFDIRGALPMNCRKYFDNFNLTPEVNKDIQRIKDIWYKCRTEYGANGDWLFGEYSIADAMFAPIVHRFNGYGVPLDDMEQAYVQATLNSPHMIEWVEAGKKEKEVIEEDEA